MPSSNPKEDQPGEPRNSKTTLWFVMLLILSTLFFENYYTSGWIKENHCIADKIPFYTATCETLEWHRVNSGFMSDPGLENFKPCRSAKWAHKNTGLYISVSIFILISILMALGRIKASRMIGYTLAVFMAFWLIEIPQYWLDFNLTSPNIEILIICALTGIIISTTFKNE